MRERKEAIMPRGQGKVKRKRRKTERSGAWESEKEQTCPAGRESEEEKRENMAERGMGERKGAIMPRRKGKVKRKRGKTEPSGAWESGKGQSCPEGREK